MKNLKVLFLFMLALALSCNEHNAVNNDTDDLNKTIEIQNILLSVPPDVNDEDILGRIIISKDAYIPFDSYVYQETFLGNFWNRNIDWNIDAGDVYLDGNLINKEAILVDELTQDSAYSYYDDISVNPDGRAYVVDISGSSDYPVCSITIDSPSGEIELTNISNGTTINKNQDLSVNWTCSSDTTTNIGIIITSDDGNSGVSVYSVDDGNEVISSSELSSLSQGNYTIFAISYKYNLLDINSDDYLLGVVMYKKEYNVYIN